MINNIELTKSEGKVRTLIVKDHSRLGRNRLVVGQLLEEDFDRLAVVQNLREHRRRLTKSGITSMFSGLLYCADCGAKLNYNAISNGDRSKAHFVCSAYRKDTVNCSAHYIREKVVCVFAFAFVKP